MGKVHRFIVNGEFHSRYGDDLQDAVVNWVKSFPLYTIQDLGGEFEATDANSDTTVTVSVNLNITSEIKNEEY